VQWHTFITSPQDTEEGNAAILYLPDRTIVEGGWSANPVHGDNDFALSRLADDGTVMAVNVVNFEGAGARKDDSIKAIALQGNQIIAVGLVADPLPGNARTIGVMRFNLDSTLSVDTSFGSNGRFEFQFDQFSGSKDLPTAVAIQPDGKIVVAGRWGNAPGGGSYFAVARALADGSGLDTSFGCVVAPCSGVTGFHALPTSLFDGANAVSFQPDTQGNLRIVAAGVTGANASDFDTHDTVVVRLRLDNGTRDRSFNSAGAVPGVLVVDFAEAGHYEDIANGLVVQPDRKIVTVGYTNNKRYAAGVNYNWAFTRINEDGSGLDPGFGVNPGGGREQVDFAGRDSFRDIANSVALQDDGDIVAAGQAHADGSNAQFAVARLTPAGALDPTFNSVTTGRFTFNYWPAACLEGQSCKEDQLEDVAIWPGAPDPYIAVAGYHRNNNPNNQEDAAAIQLCQGCSEPMPSFPLPAPFQAFVTPMDATCGLDWMRGDPAPAPNGLAGPVPAPLASVSESAPTANEGPAPRAELSLSLARRVHAAPAAPGLLSTLPAGAWDDDKRTWNVV
jgi:uncharacterized delta-60 repeat protein